MIKLVDQNLEDYARAHGSPANALLEELREYTWGKMAMPQMQVGLIEGNFLRVLVRATQAKRVLEVGTFTGYSALNLAAGLPDDGRLITCELNPENAAIARSFFDRSPDGHKIEIRLGPATETLATLEGLFDLAFIDADKTNYTRYFEMIRPRMRSGGLIVVDNVLWSGRVLEPVSAQDADTAAIVAFNQHVARLVDLDKVMLTVRDGMTLIVV